MTTFDPGHLSPLDRGVHGQVERVWEQDGVADLRRVVMVQDGANAYTAAVASRFLRFTAGAAGGNQRECWLIPGTEHTDCELEVGIGAADTLAGGIAQWGVMPRVLFDSAAGLWRGYSVWTDTTIPVPTLLNYGVTTFANGLQSLNNVGNNPVPQALTAVRYCAILRAQRTANVSTYWCSAGWLPAVGTTVSVLGMAAGGFNAAGVAVTAVDYALRTFSIAQVAADATDADAGGRVEPATVAATTPFRLGVRLVGTTLTSRIWHQEESRPDWTDANRVFSYTLAGGSPAPHSGVGLAGLWVAHLSSPNQLRFSDFYFRKLS